MKKLKASLKSSQIMPLLMLIGYPFLIMMVLGWFVIPELKWYVKEVIAIALATLLVTTIVLFVSNVKLKKFVAAIAIALIGIAVFVKLSFYYHYKVPISASALYVLFETHQTEASDFLKDYFSIAIFGLVVILVIPAIFVFGFFLKSKRFNPFKPTLKTTKQLILGGVTILILSSLIYWKFQKENLILLSVSSYSDYKNLKKVLKNELSKPQSDALEISNFNTQSQTNIIIIGESTSNWHMQLYGYNRATNPLLSEIKSELMIFDSVIAPNVHTILSLDKIFTLSDYEHPQKESNGSIVQLANEANFETYWLSNQRPVGLHESIPTLIGNAAKHKYFVNSMDYMDAIYDEKLLPVLDSILDDAPQRKQIFIHLIGTHGDYKKRYPPAFAHFKNDTTYSDFVPKGEEHRVDAYDNAIRYNDFIVRSIIDKAKNIENAGYVLYFSDHGDEVYDTMELTGHNEYHATRPMYEVPFLIWFSENYKAEYPQILYSKTTSQRPYNMEHLFHSFADLNGIDFKGFDTSKSVFNKNFKKRTRWIKEGIDYDKR